MRTRPHFARTSTSIFNYAVAGVRVWVDATELTTIRNALAGHSPLVNEQLAFVPMARLELDPEAQAAHDETIDEIPHLPDWLKFC